MGKTLRKKKRAPISTITLLTIVIFCVALLSYLIPAGEYERMVNATGQTVIVPGSFHFVDSTPVSFQTLMSVFYNALIRASELIAFVLVVGGSFGVITQTGAIAAGLNKLVTKLGGKSEFIILIVMIVFCIGGASYGMTEETIPFVAIMIPVAIKMGFDPIVGVSMVIIGCYCGYSGGALNPFGTGIAQEICELPTFSGIELRIILTIGALIISAHHIISYGRKFKRRVASGELTPDFEGYVLDESIAGEIRDLNRIDKIILVILGTTILILVVGVMAFKWYFEEMAALFTTMAIVAGLIYYKGDLNATMQTFVNGAKDMAGTVIVIGMARGVLVMMESGGIMDTVIYALSIPFTQMNSIFTAWGMYIVMAIINFVIPSSTGAATAVMPIFSSLADLTGITRQTAVLAFQCGVSGLAFKTAFFKALPQEIYQLAEQNNFAIFRIDDNVPYREIICDISDAIKLNQDIIAASSCISRMLHEKLSVEDLAGLVTKISSHLRQYAKVVLVMPTQKSHCFSVDHVIRTFRLYKEFSGKAVLCGFYSGPLPGLALIVTMDTDDAAKFNTVANHALAACNLPLEQMKIAYSEINPTYTALDRCVVEAYRALLCSQILDRDQMSYHSIGTLSFLIPTVDNPHVRPYMQTFLAPILLNEESMNTAISFVRAGGHLEQAARTLCLHKNTLRYRVNKLHSQLAPDLSDEDFYEALSTAIKIYLICQYRT